MNEFKPQKKVMVRIFYVQVPACFVIYFISWMKAIKGRNWTTQEDQQLKRIMDESTTMKKKLTWNQISSMMRRWDPSNTKTGKQCRERWANQLNPDMEKYKQWEIQENILLFQQHSRLGNKWSSIAENMKGRTDNCVKNHFYSVIRKGLRNLNKRLEMHKKKTGTNIKYFKSDQFTKILSVLEEKFCQKYIFNETAVEYAHKIKDSVIHLGIYQDVDPEQEQTKRALNIYFDYHDFSRNCKKKKTKQKRDQDRHYPKYSKLKRQNPELKKSLRKLQIKHYKNQYEDDGDGDGEDASARRQEDDDSSNSQNSVQRQESSSLIKKDVNQNKALKDQKEVNQYVYNQQVEQKEKCKIKKQQNSTKQINSLNNREQQNFVVKNDQDYSKKIEKKQLQREVREFQRDKFQRKYESYPINFPYPMPSWYHQMVGQDMTPPPPPPYPYPYYYPYGMPMPPYYPMYERENRQNTYREQRPKIHRRPVFDEYGKLIGYQTSTQKVKTQGQL